MNTGGSAEEGVRGGKAVRVMGIMGIMGLDQRLGQSDTM